MTNTCFVSSNEQLCKFLRTTGRDWRNTLYIECGHCERAVSRSCHNLLCAFDEDGSPVLLPVRDAADLLNAVIDKSECRSTISKSAFSELYKNWLDCHIRDPHDCPLCSLYVNWGPADPYAEEIFPNR